MVQYVVGSDQTLPLGWIASHIYHILFLFLFKFSVLISGKYVQQHKGVSQYVTVNF